mgnify:CR=1 FL=1
MKVVLYLFLANFGWLEFESYPSFEACKTAEAHILEGNDKSWCRTEKELAEIIEIDLYK